MNRPLVGAIALVLLAVGGLLWWSDSSASMHEQWIAATLRVGAIMAALWLALPELTRLPRWLLIAVLVAVCLVALRPRMFLVAVVAAIVVAFLRPRWHRSD